MKNSRGFWPNLSKEKNKDKIKFNKTNSTLKINFNYRWNKLKAYIKRPIISCSKQKVN